jgi:hypothetical protein
MDTWVPTGERCRSSALRRGERKSSGGNHGDGGEAADSGKHGVLQCLGFVEHSLRD